MLISTCITCIYKYTYWLGMKEIVCFFPWGTIIAQGEAEGNNVTEGEIIILFPEYTVSKCFIVPRYKFILKIESDNILDLKKLGTS